MKSYLKCFAILLISSVVKMAFRLEIHHKCRICLALDINAAFIKLKGRKAIMFAEVIGVEV